MADDNLKPALTIDNAHEHPDATPDMLHEAFKMNSTSSGWESNSKLESIASHPKTSATTLTGIFNHNLNPQETLDDYHIEAASHSNAPVDLAVKGIKHQISVGNRDTDKMTAHPHLESQHFDDIGDHYMETVKQGVDVGSGHNLKPSFGWLNQKKKEFEHRQPEAGQMTELQIQHNRAHDAFWKLHSNILGNLDHDGDSSEEAMKFLLETTDQKKLPDRERALKRFISKNKSLSSGQLDRLWAHSTSDESLRDLHDAILSHPNTDSKLLQSAVKSKKVDTWSKDKALANPNLDEGFRKKTALGLTKESDSSMAGAIADNPKSTEEEIDHLYKNNLIDPTHNRVTSAMIEKHYNPKAPAKEVRKLLDAKKTPASVLKDLVANNKNQNIATDALKHPNADIEVVKAGLARKAKDVQAAASMHPLVLHEALPAKIESGAVTIDKLTSDRKIADAFSRLAPEKKKSSIQKFLSSMSEAPETYDNSHAGTIVQHGDDEDRNNFVKSVASKALPNYGSMVNKLANQGNEEARKLLLSPKGTDHVSYRNLNDWHPEEKQVRELFEAHKSDQLSGKDRWLLTRESISDDLFDSILGNENLDQSAVYGKSASENLIRQRYGNLSAPEKEVKASKLLEKPHTAPLVLSSGLLENNPDKWNQVYDSMTDNQKEELDYKGVVAHPHVMAEYLTGSKFNDIRELSRHISPEMPGYDSFKKIMLSDQEVRPEALNEIHSEDNIDVLSESIKNNSGGFHAAVNALSSQYSFDSESKAGLAKALKESAAPVEKKLDAIKNADGHINEDLFSIADGTEKEREFKQWAISRGLIELSAVSKHIAKHPEDFSLAHYDHKQKLTRDMVAAGTSLDTILQNNENYKAVALAIAKHHQAPKNIADYLQQSNHSAVGTVLSKLLSEDLHARNGGLKKDDKVALIKNMGQKVADRAKQDPNYVVNYYSLKDSLRDSEYSKHLPDLGYGDFDPKSLAPDSAFEMMASESVPDSLKEKISAHTDKYLKQVNDTNYHPAFKAATALGSEAGEKIAYKAHASALKTNPAVKPNADKMLTLWIDHTSALNDSKPTYSKAIKHIDAVLESPDSDSSNIDLARSALRSAASDANLSNEDAIKYVLNGNLGLSDASNYETVLNHPEIFKQKSDHYLHAYIANANLLDRNTEQAVYDKVMSAIDPDNKASILTAAGEGNFKSLTPEQYTGLLRSLPEYDALNAITLKDPSKHFSTSLKFVNGMVGSADEEIKKRAHNLMLDAVKTYTDHSHKNVKMFDTEEVEKSFDHILNSPSDDIINREDIQTISEYPHYNAERAHNFIAKNSDQFTQYPDLLLKATRLGPQAEDWTIDQWSKLTEAMPHVKNYLLDAAKKVTLDHVNAVDLKALEDTSVINGLTKSDKDAFVKLASARPEHVSRDHIEDRADWIDTKLADKIAKKQPDMFLTMINAGAGGKDFFNNTVKTLYKDKLSDITHSPYINELGEKEMSSLLKADPIGILDGLAFNMHTSEQLLDKVYELNKKTKNAGVDGNLLRHPNISKKTFQALKEQAKKQEAKGGFVFDRPSAGPGYILNPKYGFDEFAKLPKAVPEEFKKQVDLSKAPKSVSVGTALDRLNQVLPHMKPEGLTWQEAKKAVPAIENWQDVKQQFLAQPNHTLTPEKLTEMVSAAENKDYGITFASWDGGQRHSNRNNLVMQINLGDKMQKELAKDPDVWALYRHIQKNANSDGHPASPYGIGWVRLDLANPKSLVVEEFQSDLAKYKQSIVKELLDNDRDSIKLEGRTIPASKIKEAMDKINDVVGDWHKASNKAVESFAKSHGYDNLYLHGPELRAHLSQMDKDRELPTWLTEMYERYPKKTGWSQCDYRDYPNHSKDRLSQLQKDGRSTRCWKKKLD